METGSKGKSKDKDKSKSKVIKERVEVEEALRKFLESISWRTRVVEVKPTEACGMVLAEDVHSCVWLPPFDRATMDGYAVRAEDTFGASQLNPVILELSGTVEIGKKPEVEVERGKAVKISTGAMMPANSNAVVMVEYTSEHDGIVEIYKPVSPGENVIHAGSDVMAGELIVRKGYKLTAREAGIIAAVGIKEVKVYKLPVVGVISTGNEITLWGEKLEAGKIYDVNSAMLHSAIRENGGVPKFMGIVGDNFDEITSKIKQALKECDIIVLSGGTSAGEGDIVYRVLSRIGKVLVHGIAVKPGKPAVFALVDGKPVFGLPGYPTSAFMVFERFVAPVIRYLSGLDLGENQKVIKAKLAMDVFSAHGRREFLPVSIVQAKTPSAYPVGGNYSAYISKLAEADGFIEIPESVAFLEPQMMDVYLFSSLKPSDIVIIGSHCIGLDVLIRISKLKAKIINAGSTGGLLAVKRGEADLAGTHLLDEESGEYNVHAVKKLVGKDAVLVKGYLREQGFIVAKGNPKGIKWFDDLLREDVRFINRNVGSGTRVLLDMHLKALAEKMGVSFEEVVGKIEGYSIEAKTHNAIAVSVLMGKADVGLGIKSVADYYGLDFIPVRDEEYDFAVRKDRLDKESVKKFLETLKSEEFAKELKKLGMRVWERTGEIVEV